MIKIPKHFNLLGEVLFNSSSHIFSTFQSLFENLISPEELKHENGDFFNKLTVVKAAELKVSVEMITPIFFIKKRSFITMIKDLLLAVINLMN